MIQHLTLPFPPSANQLYRSTNKGVRISMRGRVYREEVALCVIRQRAKHMSGRLAVLIEAYMPDRRQHNIDNLLKATLDCMQHSGVYDDDEQIDILHIERCSITPGGQLVITLEELGDGASEVCALSPVSQPQRRP
jgi:crossover junction endodeoxyribonuclease RusA